MHGSVREELEKLLAAKPSAEANISNHLSTCEECARDFEFMRIQSCMLKTLKAPQEIEPSAGFYARVLQRIEQSARRSIWWVFVYSPVGKRLAYASLAITLALGTYVVAAESNDGHLSTDAAVRRQGHYDALVAGSTDEQRAAVLANFVAHPSTSDQSGLQPVNLPQTTLQ
jgi:predicted anti-sigma-YlaC factor YlaD